ncbi:TPA: hypothetical protein TXU83_001311 [Streptococcus suis]|nr:hypothetical protein [Streptococcus suis]HEL1777158.1 hypothetical protein [Streptococcus suis]HEL2491530.1 hypothetical protein [Streptococcus suis]HEL2514761.1 hypothetical protein [Streptococcus suis]
MKKYIVDMLEQKQILALTLSDGQAVIVIEVANEHKGYDNLIEVVERKDKTSFLLNLDQVITVRPYIPTEWAY